MTTITEAGVEAATLAWLAGVGWQVKHGRDIAPDAPGGERENTPAVAGSTLVVVDSGRGARGT